MIHYYRFCNFASFAEVTLVDFRVKPPKPEELGDERIFQAPSGQWLSKAVAVVGANASGKSNLLMPLSFLAHFVGLAFDSVQRNKKPFLHIVHRLFESDPAEIWVQFECKGIVYRYELSITVERVMREVLFEKTSRVFSMRFIKIWENDAVGYSLKHHKFQINVQDIGWQRHDASVIDVAARYASDKALLVRNFFLDMYNYSYTGQPWLEMAQVAKLMQEDAKLKEDILSIVKGFDFGVAGLDIEKNPFFALDGQSSVNISEYNIYCRHESDLGRFTLPIRMESQGTRGAVILLTWLLHAFSSAQMVVVDELELHMHPNLFDPLINIMLSSYYNPRNVQVIFTTHQPEILHILSKEQIVLVEKREAVSEAWRLADIKGLRPDEHLVRKYLAGALGATPEISI